MKNNDQMEKVIEKAQTLIEALPYIKRFNGTKIVVKYGGSAMLDEELKFHVIQDVALLKLVGMKPIIVHGGGKEISKWIDKLGMETRFENGLRVTDEPVLEVAEMVLNNVNKSLVGLMSKVGLNAVGVSGKDAGLLKCKRKTAGGKDIGFVGEIVETNVDLINTLIDKYWDKAGEGAIGPVNGVLKVICPFAAGFFALKRTSERSAVTGAVAGALFEVILVAGLCLCMGELPMSWAIVGDLIISIATGMAGAMVKRLLLDRQKK